MRLVYFGTPETAVMPLRSLCAAGHEVVLVVTGADTRRGRGSTVTPSPVKAAALELGLAVSHNPLDVLTVQADLGVVVAFGRLISSKLLDHLSMVNLHFSLLPRWRGAAPVERAILAGDGQTGVCLMEVAEGLDTGGIYAQEVIALDDQISAADLRVRLVELGSELLVQVLRDGLGVAVAQSEEGVTYAHKLHSADAELHWEAQTEDLLRIIRVGGAWTTFRKKRFKVVAAQRATPAQDAGDQPLLPDPLQPGSIGSSELVKTADSWIKLLLVQPEGKAAMTARDWANGAHPDGEVFGL
jgi:methionyl-tRNA formyltransferase